MAYDFHSGIDSIYWRLYDNVTGDEIIHGHEDLFAQGSTEVRAASIIDITIIYTYFFKLLNDILFIPNLVYFYKQHQEECLRRYGNCSRGPNCYQTNHWGAFHKHFQIKPEVKRDGGLIHGKDVGLHDSEYYLEVKVTNIALLSTLLTKKVKRLTYFSNK